MVGLFADLGDRIEATNKQSADLLKLAKPIRKVVGTATSGVANSATVPLFIQINDAPAEGRIWFVTRVGIFGNDGHTVVTGATFEIYFGPAQEVQGNTAVGVPITPQLYQMETGTTIPIIFRYGHFDHALRSMESIYAWLYAVPNNQQIQLVAEVNEYWSHEVEATRIAGY